MDAERDTARREGWRPVLRVHTPRLRVSRAAGNRTRRSGLVSGAAHIVVLLAVWWLSRGGTPAEQQQAPAFAVQFVDAGSATPAPAAPESQAQVNLGGAEPLPAPPEEQPVEHVPVPPPARHYGSALRPKADRNPFAHVMPFDLSQHSSHQLASSSLGRGLDLSAGPVVEHGALHDSVRHVMGTHGMSDWGEELREFVEEHKYYPREAAENGEQGSAVVRMTVSRDGTVRKLTLISSSGSHLLDAAWMAVFRDNKLPPFNDDMPENEMTFSFELDYHLIYGSH